MEHERGRDDAPAPANVGRLDADSGGMHRDLVIALQIPPGCACLRGQLEPSRNRDGHIGPSDGLLRVGRGLVSRVERDAVSATPQLDLDGHRDVR
jgi:hypothetical protein